MARQAHSSSYTIRTLDLPDVVGDLCSAIRLPLLFLMLFSPSTILDPPGRCLTAVVTLRCELAADGVRGSALSLQGDRWRLATRLEAESSRRGRASKCSETGLGIMDCERLVSKMGLKSAL